MLRLCATQRIRLSPLSTVRNALTNDTPHSFFHTNQFLADIKVHLIQLSTGTSHPAALQPIIDVPRMPFLPGNCSVSIEVVGDTLGVLFNLTRLHHAFGGGTAIRFHLYNWKSGRMLFVSAVFPPSMRSWT